MSLLESKDRSQKSEKNLQLRSPEFPGLAGRRASSNLFYLNLSLYAHNPRAGLEM